jgi:hypothetical protein
MFMIKCCMNTGFRKLRGSPIWEMAQPVAAQMRGISSSKCSMCKVWGIESRAKVELATMVRLELLRVCLALEPLGFGVLAPSHPLLLALPLEARGRSPTPGSSEEASSCNLQG